MYAEPEPQAEPEAQPEEQPAAVQRSAEPEPEPKPEPAPKAKQEAPYVMVTWFDSSLLITCSPPPASTKSAKPRKRDSWRSKLAAGGRGKQRLLMLTAPKETKPLVAALQQQKAKGADIKPLVDSMLATIAS